MMATNHDTFLFHQWYYIFGLRYFQICFQLFHWTKIEFGIEILQLTITRNKHVAIIGRITRELKLPNIPLSFWTPSSAEASNDELGQKPVVVLTYNTIKGFKMKQDMRYKGYS